MKTLIILLLLLNGVVYGQVKSDTVKAVLKVSYKIQNLPSFMIMGYVVKKGKWKTYLDCDKQKIPIYLSAREYNL